MSAKICVLLDEADPDLRELNALVLREDGYAVETLPDGADLVDFAEQSQPQVIVLGVTYGAPQDRLQANPRTRTIPVVVVTDSIQLAGEAKVTPVTRRTVVAPYDISALEDAVAKALKNPPPAAVLPPARRPAPPAVAYATEHLARNASVVVLRTIRAAQRVEPYKSRFGELTPRLVDELASMLSAITEGIKRSLSPSEVFSVPAVQREIDAHVHLRRSQHVGAAAAIHADQLLQVQIGDYLRDLIDEKHFTACDAFMIDLEVQRYVSELVRQIVQRFTAQSKAR